MNGDEWGSTSFDFDIFWYILPYYQVMSDEWGSTFTHSSLVRTHENSPGQQFQDRTPMSSGRALEVQHFKWTTFQLQSHFHKCSLDLHLKRRGHSGK